MTQFIQAALANNMMHDIVIFLAFIGILLAPAIVATNAEDISDKEN